jgi:hypothetical protein
MVVVVTETLEIRIKRNTTFSRLNLCPSWGGKGVGGTYPVGPFIKNLPQSLVLDHLSRFFHFIFYSKLQ